MSKYLSLEVESPISQSEIVRLQISILITLWLRTLIISFALLILPNLIIYYYFYQSDSQNNIFTLLSPVLWDPECISWPPWIWTTHTYFQINKIFFIHWFELTRILKLCQNLPFCKNIMTTVVCLVQALQLFEISFWMTKYFWQVLPALQVILKT